MSILNRKKSIIFILAGFVATIILVGSAISVTAQDLSKITYPVAELGSCGSEQECKAYCSIASNYSKCAAFAQKIGLVTELPDDKKAVLAAMEKGDAPGGCTDEASCRNYCEDVDHLGECVDFVEKFKFASSDELKEMRQMADVKKAGVQFPGNCKTKESCLKYCDNSANAVVCMEFAQKAGFIPKEDIEAVSKIIPYLKSGGKLPSGCTRKESCDTYCASDTHVNECADFAVGAGFMTKEEGETIKRTGGKGPGNCRSREACDNYCKDEAHADECIDFAVKAGFISQEDAEQAKKFGITSGGPGGCKSKAECETFCVLPENQETCSNWAKEHGMDTGGEGVQDRGAEECVKQGGTPDGKTCKFPEGQFPGIQCESPPCGPLEQPGDGQGGPPTQFVGPGGCKNPDECKTYCEANPQACQGSRPPSPPNFDRGAEECLKQGGNLKDGQCYFNDPTQKDIGVDHGGEECAKQGGNWTGSSCNFPPPPTQTEPPSGDGQQQYPLLLRYPPFAEILNFILGR